MKKRSNQKFHSILAAAVACSVLVACGMARAENHALIMSIDYRGVLPPRGGELPGSNQDGMIAKRIALGIGVPEANITWLRNDQLKLSAMTEAFNALIDRVKEGDKVFLYYSGHGHQKSASGGRKCTQMMVAHDLGFFPDEQVRRLLDILANRASQVVMFNDSCFSGGGAGPDTKALRDTGGAVPKYFEDSKAGSSNDPDYVCGQAVNKDVVERTLGVFKRPQPARMLYVAASADNEVSWSTPAGSVATLAWAQCLGSKSADRDGNGLVDGNELKQCAQEVIQRTSRQTQTVTLLGSASLPLAFNAGGNSGGSNPVANPARALESFLASADPTIKVSLAVAKANLKIDQDLLDFSVGTDRDGYLHLLHVGTDGKFYVLFPNGEDRNNFVKAGSHRFPRPAWGIKALGPAGTGYIMAYLSDAPRDFSKELDKQGGFGTGDSTEGTVRKLGVVALTGRFGASQVVPINEVR